MGCCGDREKAITVSEEQKWDYITLSDFKSTSCLAPFSYIWLWLLVIISIAVYVADAFTAVNLLAFNKWSSEIKPAIPFDVAKWIFAVCIILSYVLLAIDWIRAFRVIRSGGVAENYLDPIAAIFQSMRFGKGQGWRRFLVFAELTKSKKGVDYVALFVYFQFKGALLIVLAEGPRVVVNGITLWAVMQASLIPVGKNAGKGDHSSFQQFWINVEVLAGQNKQETVVYFTMLFSLVIWVIAALSLFISVILYVFFLWHYIPSTDGRLSHYCRRKIDSRLDRIVGKKVKKALEKQDQKRRKEEQKAMKRGDGNAQRVPTLPNLGTKDDDAASISSFTTSTTAPTLPPYTSQPPTRTNTMSTTRTGASRQPTLPSFPGDIKRPPPSRSDTQSSAFSNASYSSNAPLLSQAGPMGYTESGRGSPVPPMPPLDPNAEYLGKGSMNRTMTGSTQGSGRPYSPMGQRGPNNGYPPRLNTGYSSDGRTSPPHLISPLPTGQDPRQGPPPRSNTGYSSNSRGRIPGPSPLGDPTFSPYDNRAPQAGPAYEMSPVEMSPQNQYQNQGSYDDILDDYDPYRAPSPPNRGQAGPPPSLTPGTSNRNQYAAYNPAESRSGTVPPPSNGRPGIPATLQTAIQRREASNPLPNRGPGSVPPQRSATAPINQPGWTQGPTGRSATTDPQQQQQPRYWNGQPRGAEDGW